MGKSKRLLGALSTVVILLWLQTSPLFAAIEVPFEVFTEELKSQRDSYRSQNRSKLNSIDFADPLDSVQIHLGVGQIQSSQNLQMQSGAGSVVYQTGLQVTLGIDLFDPTWVAEGTVRSFEGRGLSGLGSSANLRANDFDLRIVKRGSLAGSLWWRVGGGLSARTLDLNGQEYRSPSSLGLLGLQQKIGDSMSVGCDLAGRSALTQDTIDRGSVDITIRLDAHF